MIKFDKKPDYQEMRSMKDFSPKSINCFFKYLGRDLYDDYIENTQPKGTRFFGLRKGKYDPSLVKKLIKETKIIHPACHKEYQASPFLIQGQKKDKEKYDQDFDLIFTIDKSGLILSPEFEYYVFLIYTLGKYRKSDSFDYKFVIRGNNYPSPIFTVPKTKEGWEELLKALLEFCVSLKLFLGIHYRTVLLEENSPDAKYFSSVIEKVTTFIPTITSLAYRTIIHPYLKKKLNLNWDKTMKANYSSSLIPKLIEHINKNYKDKLVIGDCATGSYYLNLTKGENSKELRGYFTNPVFLGKNHIDPERRRCELDWWAYAAGGYRNNGKPRDLILIADLDPVPAIFHEFGHFLENNEDYLGTLQRASKRGVFSETFISFSSFLLAGITGAISDKAGAIGEVVSWVTSILLKFPELQSEFMASYYGLQMMEKLGATEKDIENAKFALRTAYSSYVINTLKKASISGYGRITGKASRTIYDKFIKKK